MAELKISQKDFGKLTGWGRATVYRRYSGETALNTDELDHIEKAVGIRTLYLLTGDGPPLSEPVGQSTRRSVAA